MKEPDIFCRLAVISPSLYNGAVHLYAYIGAQTYFIPEAKWKIK